MHVQTAKVSLFDAGAALESHLTNRLLELDYSWAEKARERLDLELDVLDTYYEAVLREDTPEVESPGNITSDTENENVHSDRTPPAPLIKVVDITNAKPIGADVELAAEAAVPIDSETDAEEEKAKQAVIDREAMKLQYETRRTEMIWQYEPKVKVTAISSGMFHLR